MPIKIILIINISEIEFKNHFAICIKENEQTIIKDKNIAISYMIKNNL